MTAGGSNFPWATLFVATAMAYTAVGGFVALAYLLLRLDDADPAGRQSYAFRTLVAPGLMLLWPLVLHRWRIAPVKSEGLTPSRAAQVHRATWLLLAVIVPAILLAGFVQRSTALPMPPVQRLSPAGAPP